MRNTLKKTSLIKRIEKNNVLLKKNQKKSKKIKKKIVDFWRNILKIKNNIYSR